MSKGVRQAVVLGLLLLLVAAGAVLSLVVGEMTIDLSRLAEWRAADAMEYRVVRYIRLPRTLLALSVGGSLSLAGCLLQGVFRNPLVEPYTLGLSGGASLGVALTILLGPVALRELSLPLGGFAGAATVILLIYMLSLRKRDFSVEKMLLIGVMISFVTSSAVLFLEAVAHPDQLRMIVLWSMGSLSQSEPGMVYGMTAMSAVLLGVCLLFSTPLNALRLGLKGAAHLGVDTRRVVRYLLVIASVAAGCSIAAAGVIGFVGLVIPHAMRLLMGDDYRIVLPASFLSGGLFLLLCDMVARTIIAPNELPVGVITGLIGGVLFILLLTRRGRRRPVL